MKLLILTLSITNLITNISLFIELTITIYHRYMGPNITEFSIKPK